AEYIFIYSMYSNSRDKTTPGCKHDSRRIPSISGQLNACTCNSSASSNKTRDIQQFNENQCRYPSNSHLTSSSATTFTNRPLALPAEPPALHTCTIFCRFKCRPRETSNENRCYGDAP